MSGCCIPLGSLQALQGVLHYSLQGMPCIMAQPLQLERKQPWLQACELQDMIGLKASLLVLPTLAVRHNTLTCDLKSLSFSLLTGLATNAWTEGCPAMIACVAQVHA